MNTGLAPDEAAQDEFELGSLGKSLERCNNDAELGDRDVPALERESPDPPGRRPRVVPRSLTSKHYENRQRIAEVDRSEFGRGAENDVQVPGLQGSAEVRVRATFDGHERMFPPRPHRRHDRSLRASP
jgi:hypothetical protein